MGLDVSCHIKLQPLLVPDYVKAQIIGRWEKDSLARRLDAHDVIEIRRQDAFPEHLDRLHPGWYKIEGSFRFPAGSYSGYNKWRELLSRLFLFVDPSDVWSRPEHYARQPFVELINFSDCEGFIGPETSGKLRVDFENHEKRFTEHHQTDQFDHILYRNFRTAFGLACVDGCVQFH